MLHLRLALQALQYVNATTLISMTILKFMTAIPAVEKEVIMKGFHLLFSFCDYNKQHAPVITAS